MTNRSRSHGQDGDKIRDPPFGCCSIASNQHLRDRCSGETWIDGMKGRERERGMLTDERRLGQHDHHERPCGAEGHGELEAAQDLGDLGEEVASVVVSVPEPIPQNKRGREPGGEWATYLCSASLDVAPCCRASAVSEGQRMMMMGEKPDSPRSC